MISNRATIGWVLMMMTFYLHAQQSRDLVIEFQPMFGKAPIPSEAERYVIHQSDSLAFDVFRWYLSSFHLILNNEVVWTETNSYHLLDMDDRNSLSINLSIPEGLMYDQLQFNLGIDSATNASGVHGGDLDPTKGMYWTWQSGYIHFKLEGRIKVADTPLEAFQFHLGGFDGVNNTIQEIKLQTGTSSKLVISVDLMRFFQGFDLASQRTIMSPGSKAVQLSQKAAKMFTVR